MMKPAAADSHTLAHTFVAGSDTHPLTFILLPTHTHHQYTHTQVFLYAAARWSSSEPLLIIII